MKAIVRDRYGPPDVLRCEEIEKPVPRDDEVLLRVRAASVNPADWHVLRGDPFLIRVGEGLGKPKQRILGIDIAGVVDAVGPEVQELEPGDEVFGTSKTGAFAEYACVTADRLLRKPAHSSFEDVAAVPVAAVSALQGLRDRGRVRPGHKVAIHGSSGGVGTFAVQIAKALGAEVTAVCRTANIDLVRSIGADHVIDYTKEDFTRRGEVYDVIFDAAAYRSVLDYRRALGPRGIYVMIGGSFTRLLQVLLLGPLISTGGRKLGFMMAKMEREDLSFLKELLEEGKVVPVIDRRYPLIEAAEALRYLEKGHARGKVVVTV
jgi:NADPH:quinone reductase-like Zn-dependent oxidoreductase